MCDTLHRRPDLESIDGLWSIVASTNSYMTSDPKVMVLALIELCRHGYVLSLTSSIDGAFYEIVMSARSGGQHEMISITYYVNTADPKAYVPPLALVYFDESDELQHFVLAGQHVGSVRSEQAQRMLRLYKSVLKRPYLWLPYFPGMPLI